MKKRVRFTLKKISKKRNIVEPLVLKNLDKNILEKDTPIPDKILSLKENLNLFFKTKPSIDDIKNFDINKVYPWLCIDTIIYLYNYLEGKKDIKVFEFGAGLSTFWFAKQELELYSVEHHTGWFNTVKEYLKNHNLEVKSFKNTLNYSLEISNYPDNYFDIILIDGFQDSRWPCCVSSIDKVKKRGIIIVDDLTDFKKPQLNKINKLFSPYKKITHEMSNLYRKGKIKKTGIWIIE